MGFELPFKLVVKVMGEIFNQFVRLMISIHLFPEDCLYNLVVETLHIQVSIRLP